jgi:O-antigen/teichoic acid export membrane protein
MSDLKRRALTGISWSVVSQIGRQSVRFVVGILLVRLLTPRDFGLIGMVIVFTGFAELFTDLGFGAALIQKKELEQRHLNSVFWMNVVVGLLLTIIVGAVAPIIAEFYENPELSLMTAVIALSFAIGSVKVVQSSLFQKNMEFKKLAFIEITALMVSGITSVAMAYNGCGVWSLVAQSLITTSVTVAMMWTLSRWRPSFSFDSGAMKELWGFSANLTGFNVLNYWVRNGDNLLIGKIVSADALGLYTRAYSLMLLPITQITHVISGVMFPAMSEIQGDIEKSRRIYLYSNRIIALITFPMMTGLFAVSEAFVLFLFGDRWMEMIPILKVFCITGIGQSVGTTVGWIYTAQGRTDIMFKWGLFSGMVYILSFIAGLPWGAFGVALSYTVFNYLIIWYPAWAIPGRLINLTFVDMVKNLAGPFYCSVTMGVITWGIGNLLPQVWPPWAILLVQVPAGMAFYIALAAYFRVEAFKDLYKIVHEEWLTQREMAR